MLSISRHIIFLALAIVLSACVTQKENEEEQVQNTATDEQRQIRLAHQKSQLDKQRRSQQKSAQPSPLMMAESDARFTGVASRPHMPPMQPNFEATLAGEKYASITQNPIKLVTESPVSTFSIDVDTGAYSNVRRILNQGLLPTKDAIRTEELLNYFDYTYQGPENRDTPFKVNYAMLKSPWNKHKHLLQIGIKAWEPESQSERPDANLVFLVDVSGSMHAANKLPLLKKSLRMLSKQMSQRDKISIVVYAGASGVVLQPTPASDLMRIEQALSQLRAGGSTNGEAGITQAYDLAHQAFIEGGINRIILATDGDFNVGLANTDRLVELVARERAKGVALSTLGFGSGNYNDHLMEQLANKGNGAYSYIDNLLEAKKVLVEELDSQLITVAKDVKIQLEFNPSRVKEYRLVGYENRVLAREDFNNDKVDAGEIGAGHTVTAIYEITLTDAEESSIEPLRYQTEKKVSSSLTNELGFVKIRYKHPDADSSVLLSQALSTDQLSESERFNTDLRFAAAVIAFADKLQGSKYIQDFSFENIKTLANSAKGSDQHGLRAEFTQLVKLAEVLSES